MLTCERSDQESTDIVFYHQDSLGSTIDLTDTEGTVIKAYIYEAWGNFRELDVYGQSNTAPDLDENGFYAWEYYLEDIQAAFAEDDNRFTYTGHEFDPSIGLYYFKARFYDPELGRFNSQDPYLGDSLTPPSLHRYLYAYSNPLRYIDLTGYATVDHIKTDELLTFLGEQYKSSRKDYLTHQYKYTIISQIKHLYGKKTDFEVLQYLNELKNNNIEFVAVLVFEKSDYDEQGNLQKEKVYGDFLDYVGKYADHSIGDLRRVFKESLRQNKLGLTRQGINDISEIFSIAYMTSAYMAEDVTQNIAKGWGPIGWIQEHAAQAGQGGYAPSDYTIGGWVGLVEDLITYPTVGLTAFRVGKTTFSVVKTALRESKKSGSFLKSLGDASKGNKNSTDDIINVSDDASKSGVGASNRGAKALAPALKSTAPPNTKTILQDLTNRAHAELQANPGLARDLMSPGSYRHLKQGTGLAEASYGKAVERLVARNIQKSPELRQLFHYTGRTRGPKGRFMSSPDFVGMEPGRTRLLDITTEKALPRHLKRQLAPWIDFVTYPGKGGVIFP